MADAWYLPFSPSAPVDRVVVTADVDFTDVEFEFDGISFAALTGADRGLMQNWQQGTAQRFVFWYDNPDGLNFVLQGDLAINAGFLSINTEYNIKLRLSNARNRTEILVNDILLASSNSTINISSISNLFIADDTGGLVRPLDGYIKRFKINDLNDPTKNVDLWNTASGTATTWVDLLGNATTSLSGFSSPPNWQLYDDGTGSADTTITGAFSFAPFEFSGNASATLPQPISNSAFDLPELTIAGAQSASLPQPITSGAFSFNALDFSGSQSSSLPQPITNASFELPEFSVSGDISASLPDNTVTSTGAFSFAPFEFSGAQSSTQPQPTSDAAFDLPILTLLATQSASLPQPTVSGAFTLPALTINGSMSLGIPQPIVNGSFELPGFTFSGSGSATFPQPTISGSFELPAITVLGSVSLSGVVINVENSGIIILQAGESSIQLSAGDSLIYLH